MPVRSPDGNTASTTRLVHELQNSATRVHLRDSERYSASLESYFSQQEQTLQPAAVIVPQTAQEVAAIVKTFAKCHHEIKDKLYFALRSGGKAPQAGCANVQAGITIDLSEMKQVVPSSDRSAVEVGAGARWGDVYPVLDAIKLGISGGRDATVGVGGLTLGGGLSFFGPQRGFVCDDVQSFEVVLADGSVVYASQDQHSDLWRALKGGSSNFGIVTSFTFRAFDLGNIWGGQNVWSIDTASQHLEALYNFTANPTPDAHATVITSFALYQGNVIINEGLKYTKPLENPPAAFREFLDTPGCIHSTNRIQSMTEAAIEQSGFNQNGRRQALLTTTFVNNLNVLNFACNTWHASVPKIQTLKNVQWSTTFQPLPSSTTQQSSKLGGNVLGVSNAPDLIIAQIAISWDSAAHDDVLLTTAEKIIADVEDFAKGKDAYHPYKYLNYAWETQDPIGSYGEESVRFMREVSRKYDPRGMFQTGLSGGFKLAMERWSEMK